MVAAAALFIGSASGLSARAVAPEGPPPDPVVLRRCTIEFDRATMVGPALAGVVEGCLVKPGDRVERGQILGRMRDEQAVAELELRTLEAKDDVDIRLAEARKAQALNKMKTSAALLRRHVVSAEEHKLLQLEADAATLAVEQARRRFELAQVQVRKARAAVQALRFDSPHEGVVAAVLKQPGEPVAPHESVFRIVDDARVRVVGQLDVRHAWRIRVGQAVRVVPEVAGVDLAVEREAFSGRVIFVDGSIDPLTRTCKVVSSIENRENLLRAGLEARMEIDPGHAAIEGAAHAGLPIGRAGPVSPVGPSGDPGP